MALVSATGQSVTDAPVTSGIAAALGVELARANVDPAQATTSWRRLTFTDETGVLRELHLADISLERAADLFRGSYLFENCRLLARQEFTSRS